MASLFSALHSSSDTLKAYEQTLAVIQNNVGNASTPGYVAQEPVLEAASFQFGGGLAGGVIARAPISAKDVYADATVRRQTSQAGFSGQQVSSLTALQSSFDITGNGGVAGALNKFFTAASGFSASPSDSAARALVVTTAGQVASAFRTAVTDIQTQAQANTQQIQATVDQVNTIAGQLARSNSQIALAGAEDPAIDAQNRNALESLSKLANVTVQTEKNGSLTVLLGGQTPLVFGDHQYLVSSSLTTGATTGGVPAQALFDPTGREISAHITGGSLGALLQVQNHVLPGLVGGQGQSGSLNDLAKTFADRVNTLLTSGTVSSASGAAPGSPLFAYDTTSPASVAGSLSVDPAAGGATLAAADTTSSNGTANAIAALASGLAPADQVNGQTFTAFYGTIAANLGAQLSLANSQQAGDQQSLLQVKNLRAQTSGVSLDTEAERLIEFQRAYQASAKLVTVLDQMTQSVVSMIP